MRCYLSHERVWAGGSVASIGISQFSGEELSREGAM